MPVFPLGAHVEAGGVRFAVASTSADAVEVCLVDGSGPALSERRVELTERTFGVWHGHVPGIGPGQRYGYRVHGPYRPWDGLRANPAKILVDPYARRITGRVTDLARGPGLGGRPDDRHPEHRRLARARAAVRGHRAGRARRPAAAPTCRGPRP